MFFFSSIFRERIAGTSDWPEINGQNKVTKTAEIQTYDVKRSSAASFRKGHLGSFRIDEDSVCLQTVPFALSFAPVN